MSESTFTSVMTQVAQGFEMLAALILVVGLVVAVALSIRTYRRSHDGPRSYRILRQSFGGVLLLGLEVLVAGDLLRTVAVTPTLESVAVLGLIVLIRTFLSFSLEIEINGVPPWRRAVVSGATVIKNAATSADGK